LCVKAPGKGELEEMVQLIGQRARRCQARQGLLEQDAESAWRPSCVKVLSRIEDRDIIDRIPAHLCDKKSTSPARPLLTPPTRAPAETLPLFAGKDSGSTSLCQHGSQ
jgi:hypothetical protein